MTADCADYNDGGESAGCDFCKEYIPFSEAEIRMFGSVFGTADPECCPEGAPDFGRAGIPENVSGMGSFRRQRGGGKSFSAPQYGNPARDDNQSRVYLNVPYAEKDAARRLGARWDASRRKWYVPDGSDLGPFQRWLNLSERF